MVTPRLDALLAEVRACRICAAHLPLGPRPVLRMTAKARILIVGQAPGTRVHESGIPWNDKSGDRLREWMAVDGETFYDEARVAIMPMGFCYPGVLPKGGDKPPRPECAPTWHQALLGHLPNLSLTILAGQYAQGYHLGATRKKTLTETVRAWRDYGPDVIPVPHPSWRTGGWQKRNPWFDDEVLPELRRRIRQLV
ncbi:MAG: uracil-DNA glycosylase family protein [Alphaproteobacteria bacterium]|nr:uracil-DNA glycosylase family protein [Alphaproteobacteria bacterium]